MPTIELEVLAKGEQFSVLATAQVSRDLDSMDARKRARFISQMELFAEQGPFYSKLKSEGRHPLNDGSGKEIPLFAFGDRSTVFRIYGAYTSEVEPNSFTCVSCVEKKQQKADQTKLQHAAKLVGEVLKSCKS